MDTAERGVFHDMAIAYFNGLHARLPATPGQAGRSLDALGALLQTMIETRELQTPELIKAITNGLAGAAMSESAPVAEFTLPVVNHLSSLAFEIPAEAEGFVAVLSLIAQRSRNGRVRNEALSDLEDRAADDGPASGPALSALARLAEDHQDWTTRGMTLIGLRELAGDCEQARPFFFQAARNAARNETNPDVRLIAYSALSTAIDELPAVDPETLLALAAQFDSAALNEKLGVVQDIAWSAADAARARLEKPGPP